MRQSRFDPFGSLGEQLIQFRNELNNLFSRWNERESWYGAAGYPAVNMWENADAIYIESELPGLELRDLEIYVTGGNQVTLKGERKQTAISGCAWHRQEREHGSFTRVLTLPVPVNPDKVDARFENGVLLITLAKQEAAKPRKISVKAD